MARRRGKSNSKQEESWLPLDSPAGQSASRSFNEYVIPSVLLFIIAVGGSGLGWVCSDQQQMIESLSETLASMQARITKLQQQLGPDSDQLTSVGGFEERLMALEDAYARAHKQVELALATSEQIKSKDLQNKVWSLQTEMNDKLAELQQNTYSISALNAIIKNKSVEFEVVKQSINTILSANAELAIQIAGFSSTLSVTKLHLDEQISVVDGLMSQLEEQKKEINEIKELFSSNQETLAINSLELLDIKELVESEQIKRTQKLEKQLKSLYKRLEDHQMTTESLHLHLAAQLEELQIQFFPRGQQPSRAEKEVQVEDQITISDSKDRKSPGKELENVEEEFAEGAEIREEDRTKEKDELLIEQKAFGRDETSEWRVEEPVKEIQTSEELIIEIKKDFDKKQKKVDNAEVTKTSQETRTVKNEIEETAVDEVQTSLEALDVVIVKKVEIMDEKKEIPVEEEIEIYSEKANIVTSKTGKQLEVPDATRFEDFNTITTDTEEAAGEKQVELTPAQEMETSSENIETLSIIMNQEFSEERAEEHVAEEIQSGLNEISTSEIKTQDYGITEQEFGTAMEQMQIPSDETYTTTNGNVDNQMTEDILTKVEQEAGEELSTASAKKSKVSEKSVK